MLRNTIIVFAGFIFLFVPYRLLACTCMPFHELTYKDYLEYDKIFVGKIESVSLDSDIGRMAKLTIMKNYKGVEEEAFIQIIMDSGSSCSIGVHVNEVYLIFLKKGEQWSMCTRYQSLEGSDNNYNDQRIVFYSNVTEGMFSDYYEDDILAAEGKINSAKPNGEWTFYNKNGSIQSKGFFKNGQKDGTWTIYSYPWSSERNVEPDKKYINYQNGLRHGEYLRIHSSGKTMEVGYFNKENKSGKWVFFNYDGTVATKIFYENGLDTLSESFHGNGQLSTRSKGRHSLEEWFDNGRPKKTRNDTLEIDWYENGNKRYEVGKTNNRTSYKKLWWPSGQLKAHYLYQPNNKVSLIDTEETPIFYADENGEISVERGNGFVNEQSLKGLVRDSLKDGIWENVYNGMSGNIIVKTSYSMGIKNGLFQKFVDDSLLIETGNYVDGLKDGVWKIYYPNGNIKEQFEYSNNGRRLINSWGPRGTQFVQDGKGVHIVFFPEISNDTSAVIIYENGVAIKREHY